MSLSIICGVFHVTTQLASCQIRKIADAHAPGMPETFSPPPRVSDPDMHHGTSVTHVPCWMPGSLTSGFLLSWRWGKRSRHFRRMRNPQFYVSGKRPMDKNFFPVMNTNENHIQCLLCVSLIQIHLSVFPRKVFLFVQKRVSEAYHQVLLGWVLLVHS